MEEPILISFCNSERNNIHPNTQRFISTLENKCWKYQIIGEGVEWKGIMTRVEKYLVHLKTMSPTQIVILSDARDVYCLRNTEHFLTALKSMINISSQVLVSMELFAEGFFHYNEENENSQVTNLTPYWKYHKIDENTIPSGRKFVNAGLMCGQVNNLIEILTYAINNNFTDDQKALGDFMNKYPEKIVADVDAKILHTSGFGVLGGYQVNHQLSDSPNLGEILGRGAYFLHIAGCSLLKGQKEVYNIVYDCITKYHDNLNKLYPDLHYREFFSGKHVSR
jgi:hypothetical protein